MRRRIYERRLLLSAPQVASGQVAHASHSPAMRAMLYKEVLHYNALVNTVISSLEAAMVSVRSYPEQTPSYLNS